MPEDSSEDSQSSDSITSSNADLELKIKPRHLTTRILYSDYDVQKQKKMTFWAKSAVRAAVEKGADSEEGFFEEVATLMKDSLTSSSEEEISKKWHVIVGNDFGLQAAAVKGSIAFFAVGDVKLLLYRSPSG